MVGRIEGISIGLMEYELIGDMISFATDLAERDNAI